MSENKCEIQLGKTFDLKKHNSACRLCLCQIQGDQETAKLTEDIRIQYFLLTQLNVSCLKSPKILN